MLQHLSLLNVPFSFFIDLAFSLWMEMSEGSFELFGKFWSRSEFASGLKSELKLYPPWNVAGGGGTTVVLLLTNGGFTGNISTGYKLGRG